MSKPGTNVDGVLVTWGDRLFYDRVRRKKSPGDFLKPIAAGVRKAGKGGAGQGSASSAARIRVKLDATLKKKPEVMVKITGHGKHIGQIKNHLDYISRNGEVDLENQEGDLIEGRESVRDLRDDWRDGRSVIPDVEGTKRETFNIVLSMPPGTNRLGVTNAARDFAKDQFGGRFDYVFATHADDKHPHVHLVVRARGYDGKYLNPRKADLQTWRDVFAEKLGEHGIEANATKRKVRGIIRHPVKKNVLEAKKRGVALKNARDPNVNPNNPFTAKQFEQHAEISKYYGELIKGLNEHGNAADHRLADQVKAFQDQMPASRIYRTSERAREKQLSSPRMTKSPDKDR